VQDPISAVIDVSSTEVVALQAQAIQEVRARFSKEIVEVNYFGKSTARCVWVTQDAWRSVAAFLKERFEQKLGLGQFDGLFGFSIDSSVVLTYGLRDLTYVRCSVTGGAVESLRDLWPVAEFFEKELSQRFRLTFLGNQ